MHLNGGFEKFLKQTRLCNSYVKEDNHLELTNTFYSTEEGILYTRTRFLVTIYVTETSLPVWQKKTQKRQTRYHVIILP